MISKFTLKTNGDLKFFQSELLNSEKEVKHFFSTKKGGVSTGEFESFNLGIFTNDYKENIKKNFNIICKELNMNTKVAYVNQEHGKKVVIVTNESFDSVVGQKADAIVTNKKNIPVGVFTADCVPILLYDKEKKVVAAIHAGWRGVEAKILSETVNLMKTTFNSLEENILCSIGPCIGKCCFEVSPDVGEKFTFKDERDGSIYVDLVKEVYNEAIKINIVEENIDISNICTVCEKDTLYSYRRDKGKTGRLGAFIEIV